MTGPGTPWVESLEEQFIQVRGTEFVVCKDSVVFICCKTALFLQASFQNTCNFILIIDSQSGSYGEHVCNSGDVGRGRCLIHSE